MTQRHTSQYVKLLGVFTLFFALISPFLFGTASCDAAQTPTSEKSNGELAPAMKDRQIAQLVALEMSKRHFLEKSIDETIASRAMGLYIKSLDPMKLYFYQSDVDKYLGLASELPERFAKGDIQIGFDIYNLYLKRFNERTAMVLDILSQNQDFTLDEHYATDFKNLAYPQDEAEAYDRWRKRIKYSILDLRDEAKSDSQNGESKKVAQDPIERLKRRYTSLQKRIHETTNEDVLEMFLSSITSAYDPHSSYMSPSTMENFEIIMKLQLEGIGATLQSDEGYTIIKNLVPGGAADKDGRLKVEDKIMAVAQGKDGEFVDVVDKKLTDVVSLIRGKPGTLVKLEILSPDGTKSIVDLVREKIQLTDSEAYGEILEFGARPDGTPYRIGVINLPSFYLDMAAAQRGDPEAKSTTRDLKRILDQFNADKVDAVVLDLRNNGGGSLPEAISAVGLFIETGTVVQVKDRRSNRAQPQVDPDPSVSWTGPLVVMISKFSASASEIFAGAIKDYRRGIIVGDSTTHGKGSVQAVNQLGNRLFSGVRNAPDYGALKMTIQRFYRPGGASPQIKGVPADIIIPSTTDHFKDIMEADLDYPLDYDEVAESTYPVYNYVTPQIIETLRANSAARVALSEDFQKTLRNIQTYLEIKDRKSIDLNEEKFNEERKKLDTDKEEKAKLEKIINNESKIVRDAYLEEVLAITVDYINLLAGQGVTFAAPTPPKKQGSRFSFPFF